MGEFDWWSPERLSKLSRALRDCDEPCGEFGRLFVAPEVSNKIFWRDLAEECGVKAESDASSSDEDDQPPHIAFAQDVHAEIEQSQDAFIQVNERIAVGDLGAAESRLMLSLIGVKSIVYIASHEMEPLWADDGIKYNTLLIAPTSGLAQSPSVSLASQLSVACNFLSSHTPALICSSCPKLRATLAAAYLHLEAPAETSIATALDKLNALHVLHEELDAPERTALEDFSTAVCFQAERAALSDPSTPRPTSSGLPRLSRLPTPGGKRREREGEEQSTRTTASKGEVPLSHGKKSTEAAEAAEAAEELGLSRPFLMSSGRTISEEL